MSSPTGPTPKAPAARTLAFDWIDAVLMLVPLYGMEAMLQAHGLGESNLASGLGWILAFGLPALRRKLFGAPRRALREKSSLLGGLALLSIVFGLLLTGIGGYSFTRPLPPPDAAPPADASPGERRDFDELKRADEERREAVSHRMMGVGLLLLAGGAILDTVLTRRSAPAAGRHGAAP